MKKLLVLILIILLVVLTIGCSLDGIGNENEQNKISILTSVDDIYKFYPELAGYVIKFEAEKGIKVNIEKINFSNYDDYTQKLNTKLYMKEDPELVFFSVSENYGKYIDAGVALNVKEKILNYDKIYDSLKYKDSFVPVGMNYVATVLNKTSFNELGVEEPTIDWTTEDYLNIKEKWMNSKKPVDFNYIEYRDTVEKPLNNLKIMDREKKSVYLNNDDIKNLIKHARERIFSDDYIINNQYSYINYYNMFFDYNSSEYSKAMELDYKNRQEVLEQRFGAQALKTLVTSSQIEKENILILPRHELNIALSTLGFIINRNSKNTELAIEFLNGLLTDEVQLSMFNNLTYGGYPVNKDIEEKISKLEIDNGVNEDAILLRKCILETIENGECKPYKQMESMLYDFRLMLHKDLMKLIFSEEIYSDEELSIELQKLEDKYNMWLNE